LEVGKLHINLHKVLLVDLSKEENS